MERALENTGREGGEGGEGGGGGGEKLAGVMCDGVSEKKKLRQLLRESLYCSSQYPQNKQPVEVSQSQVEEEVPAGGARARLTEGATAAEQRAAGIRPPPPPAT